MNAKALRVASIELDGWPPILTETTFCFSRRRTHSRLKFRSIRIGASAGINPRHLLARRIARLLVGRTIFLRLPAFPFSLPLDSFSLLLVSVVPRPPRALSAFNSVDIFSPPASYTLSSPCAVRLFSCLDVAVGIMSG